jgi:uncharacterized membrane protein AbrB (regulator of aidB expression)
MRVILGILALPFGISALGYPVSAAGITEATSIAVALGLDPAYVAANNMLRLSLCSVAAPFLLVKIKRRGIDD